MKSDARELDQLVRDWWLTSKDDKLFERLLIRALTADPTSLVPFARAFQIFEKRHLPTAVQERVATLGRRLEELRKRALQVDMLGDLNNEPQSLFAVLDNEVAGLKGFAIDSLRQARLSRQDSRGAAAKAFLETLGWNRLPPAAADALRAAIDDTLDREGYEAWGLFVDRNADEGVALGVKLVVRDSGQELFSDANQEMREQARIAAQHAIHGRGWEAQIEWPASFSGESIGLPIYVAALVAGGVLSRHALTACTGRLDISGKVSGVSGIRAKLDAARRLGVRRVLVPRDNFDEARAVAGDELIVLPIDHVRDVTGAFRQPMSPIELGYSGLVRLVRTSLPDYQLVIEDEIEADQGLRFVVANASGNASVWVYRNGNVRAEGATGSALDAARRLVADRIPSEPEPRETLSFRLPTPHLQERYRSALQEIGGAEEPTREYEAWRMRLARGRSRATAILYTSGKCVVQGTAPAWDEVRAAAEPVVQTIGGLPDRQAPTHSRTNGKESSSDSSEPHIGTDEAGKGDYFGPLVSAAVFIDRESAARLRQMGVRDSKTLSDRRVRELAEQIRHMPDIRYAVTAINPRKFNDLYEQFRREGKNLNSLLAWGHARSIDNLLSGPTKRVNAKFVVVDQFADKHYIEQRTRRAGIPIHQRHRAEEDIAVAAASVLARDGFLQWLERWSERTQIPLPKGASTQVIEAAKQFVRRWGSRWLGEVAKLNFRTTRQVLEGEDTNAERRPPPWISETADIQGES